MSTTSSKPSALGRKGRNFVHTQYDALTAVLDRLETPRDRWAPRTLVPADEPPSVNPLWQHLHGRMKQWLHAGLVERADQFDGDTDCHNGQPVRFTPAAIRAIEAHEPQSVELACGHHGFRNLRDGGYACRAPWCEREYTRAELEAALEGDG